ncbi:MAG TPA: hypothetical protein VF705_10175 [Longimicrobium sp.]|jgi:hypothetical protein
MIPRRGFRRVAPRLRAFPLQRETERERERREFFARENAAYERLRADPAAWNAMLKESEAIDPASVHPSDWLQVHAAGPW